MVRGKWDRVRRKMCSDWERQGFKKDDSKERDRRKTGHVNGCLRETLGNEG